MQTKHTPGPWRSADHGIHHGCRLVYGPDGYLIADAGRIPARPSAEMDANARLIAAAPQLLESLRPLATWAEHERRKHAAYGEDSEAAYMGTLADNAIAAIAKATAE